MACVLVCGIAGSVPVCRIGDCVAEYGMCWYVAYVAILSVCGMCVTVICVAECGIGVLFVGECGVSGMCASVSVAEYSMCGLVYSVWQCAVRAKVSHVWCVQCVRQVSVSCVAGQLWRTDAHPQPPTLERESKPAEAHGENWDGPNLGHDISPGLLGSVGIRGI